MRGLVGSIVLVLLAAGCGSATSSGHAGGSATTELRGFTIAAVASGTIAARTAHVDGTITESTPDGTTRGTFHGDADFAHHASDVTYSYAAATGTDSGETRVVGDTTYVRSAGNIGNTKFIAMPKADVFESIGGDSTLGGDSSIGTTLVGWGVEDPVGALDGLRALASETNDLGVARVDGAETKRVQLTTTVGAIFGCQGAASSDPEDGPCSTSFRRDHASVNVWVDDSSRMVRVDAVLDFGSDGTVESRVDYTRFGAPVHIAAPSKSELLDPSSLDQ